MTYGPEQVSRDLALLRDNAAAFGARPRLENHLLSVLRLQGSGAVASLLESLPDHGFRRTDDGSPGPEARYASAGPGPRSIVVATYLGPNLASVNVTVDDTSRLRS